MKIRTRLFLIKWNIRDKFVFRNRKLFSYSFILIYYLCVLLKLNKFAYKSLLFSHRFGTTHLSVQLIKKNIKGLVHYSTCYINDETVVNPEFWIKSRCTILANPVAHKKGVILIKFTPTFTDVMKELDCKKLLNDYWLVLEPSWAGYALPEIFAWMKFDEKIVVQSSEKSDRELLNSLNTNLIPVSYGASDWVNPEIFFETESIKTYDSIYVANYNSIKRHYVFLEAVNNIIKKIPTYKAAMVCGEWGDSKEQIIDIINSLGLEKAIDIYEEIPQYELNVLLNKSKVNVLLSLKEGSNKSLFEGMFSGVPGIVLKSNSGVNKDYFTNQSGMVIEENKLVDALEYFYSKWGEFKPREWALKNIAPEATTMKLEGDMENISGIVYKLPVKVNQPESIIKDSAKRIEINDDFFKIYKYQ